MYLLYSLLALILSIPPRQDISIADGSKKIPDHTLWTSELRKYVSDEGEVDYSVWKENQENLDIYLSLLSGPLPLSNWSQNVQLAYWINLYNAYTIKLVLNHYPINSLQEVFAGQPFQVTWIKIDTVDYSLDKIAHEIRHQFNEPRIHFALASATKSSAILLNEAYEPDRLDAQLDLQTKHFINDPSFIQLNDSALVVSPLFNLFEADFKPTIVAFINPYFPKSMPPQIAIEFMPFDWSLNGHATD